MSLEVAPTARTSPGKQDGNAQSPLRHRPRRSRRRPPVDLQRRFAQHPLLRRHRRGPRRVREARRRQDRKSTRLNSSHANISYAVFCLKKKKNNKHEGIDKQKKTKRKTT